MIIMGPIQFQIFHDSMIALDIKLEDLYCILMNHVKHGNLCH